MPPEFSRPTRLPHETRQLTLTASAAECAALAERFAILGIGRFAAELTLVPETGGSVRVHGKLSAQVTQECVASLEPVVQKVAAPIELRLLAEGEIPADDDPDSPDEIESHHGMVDLGEVCAEQLALALDPYPRLPEARLPAELLPPEEEIAPELPKGRPNPFATLAQLKRG